MYVLLALMQKSLGAVLGFYRQLLLARVLLFLDMT
jgi:hypothetical protein